MAVKVIFVGNIFGGDDGIGPTLYKELADHPALKDLTLMELGVIGFDMLSYVEDDDKLIIVDAVRLSDGTGKPGDVVLLNEDDLSQDLSVVSQHDFGIEQTASILRAFKPNLASINIIGIKVSNIKAFSDVLSKDLLSKMDTIKKDVISLIKRLSDEEIKKAEQKE
ncbi:hydrogenase maturation protease [Candidatus Woesearchaeota archaeon]|nr:hydrogenase maturation protease [Candidatus Woesearchaeota archaeon]